MKFRDFSQIVCVWSAFMVLGMLALASLPATDVYAQTSADLRGRVMTEAGDAVSGATVQILHMPSGTVSEAVTGETGGFFRSGLRVGGPYQVTVRAEGYEVTREEDVFLEPGSQDPLVFNLGEAGQDIDRIQVVGAVISSATALNNGVGSTFNATDIQNQPSANRDVIATLSRDALAQGDGVGNLTVAGANPRFNTFAIDGALQTDDFGLIDDNAEGTRSSYSTVRSPINLDAIESATLVYSDYSVDVSGASGASISVVTKSGTNEFDGSVYYAYQDDSFVGNDFDGGTFDPGEFEEKEYGFTIGGPIVKDELFFFVSYDEYENAAPRDFTNFDEDNGIDPAFFDVLRTEIQNTYGYDPGTRPQVVNIPTTSERALVKLDWNINEDHRASFTYQSSEEFDVSLGGTQFESAWYDIPIDLEAYTLQLNSDWTSRFSTEFRANYKEFMRGQVCRGGPDVGQISLDFEDSVDSLGGTPLEGLLTEGLDFVAGCDIFRHANEFDDERLQIFASGEYFFGDHVMSFGAELNRYDLRNLFIFASRGDYVFTDYNQLVNRDPLGIFYQNIPSNNAAEGAAEWGYDKLSLFVGDSWAITSNFEVDYGIRYETFSQDEKPAFSQAILDRHGVRSDENIDGKDLIMPRVSFFWKPAERTTVTGGLGLFPNSAPPLVWISNAFNLPVVGDFQTGFEDVDLTQIPQPLLDEIAKGTPAPSDVISKDFDTPSDWKASIRVEQGFDLQFGNFDFGDNYRATAQLVYTRAKDGFIWRNLTQTGLDEALPVGTAPDGRPIYADLAALGFTSSLIALDNTDGAESLTATLGLAKQYDNGINFDVSYAYTDAEVVSEGGSSRGISNWRGQFTIDRNDPLPRTSPFEIEHSFKFNFGYEKRLFGDLSSRVDVFGRVFKGDTYGTSFDISGSNSLFGRGGFAESPFDNQPLYVPSPDGDPLVVYGSGFDVEGFFDFINSNDIPTGGIHEPYSAVSDHWNNIWDLRFQQELPGIPGFENLVGPNNFKLVLDVENFLNLVNDDWGRVTDGPFFGQADIVDADLVSAADVAENGIEGATALTGDLPRQFCQAASDCIYRFNEFDGTSTEFTDRDDSVYEIRLTLRYDF